MTFNFLRQVFSPNPSDILMKYVKKQGGSSGSYQFPPEKAKISPANSFGVGAAGSNMGQVVPSAPQPMNASEYFYGSAKL
jgi:hypothetical protein